MNLLKNLFGGSVPTTADIDAQLSKLEQERADIEQERQRIEQSMAGAYGSDTDTAPLERDYSRLELRLRQADIVAKICVRNVLRQKTGRFCSDMRN